MKDNFRKTLATVGAVLLLLNLWTMDYDHLWSRENFGNALGAISNICLIAAMLVSLRYTKKQEHH